MLTTFGLAVALLGILILFAGLAPHGGDLATLDWRSIAAHAHGLSHRTALFALVLLLVGLAAKIGWAPVHNWLPDAHSEAPPPVSALLSAALLPTVMLIAWRVVLSLESAATGQLGYDLMLTFGLASLAFAIPFLWRPMPWKRLLAYSSLEHMGILALGIGFHSPLATIGVLVHLAGHALAKSLGFYTAIPLLRHEPATADGPPRGLVRLSGPVAAGVGVSLGTLSGLPPSPLFLSELLILAGGLAAHQLAIVAVAAVLMALGFLGLAHALIEALAGTSRGRRPALRAHRAPHGPAHGRRDARPAGAARRRVPARGRSCRRDADGRYRVSAGTEKVLSALAPARVEEVASRQWRAACERQAQAGWRFCGLFAGKNSRGLRVSCVFARGGREHVLSALAPRGSIDTLVDLFAAAAQDEREAHDSYGLRFDGHEPLRPLIEHPPEPAAWTVPVEGHDAYQVAVGPIHAGVIESGHFRFTVVGERILHLDLRLFYKHRGLQLAAEGRPLTDGLAYAGRACAACAVTNTVAYAQACESALGLAPDAHLRRARTLLLELERLYNHLNDISAVCAGVGFAPGTMAFAALKERAQRLNERLTGHRFLFGVITLAGSALRIGPVDARPAGEELRALADEERELWRELRFAGSLQDRLGDVGRVSREDALRLGALGPSARACGVRQDTRSESPRLHYREFAAVTPANDSGDVAARLDARQVELEQTFAILEELLSENISPGGVTSLDVPASEVGVSRVESPRGETVCVVQHNGGTIRRLHLRTGSFANWPVLAHAARENLLPDFPLINKSFELCYACADR